LQFHQIPAFTDNYLWMIESLGHSWVVDPGDGQVIIHALKQQSSILDGILITHHHADHIGGIGDLITWVRENQGHDLRIIGPDKDTIPHKTQTVYDGEIVEIFTGVHLQVLEVPGHTKGHIAYFLPKIAGLEVPRLYCGDTLFAGTTNQGFVR
jgi:hydroxyacylglutathione hydrolase